MLHHTSGKDGYDMYQGYDYLFKMLLIGDSGVGKSSLLLRFTDNTFVESFVATIGVDFKIKTMTIDGATVKLQIWDTAGQERFRTITSTYYRGSHGIIVVFDITNPTSFQNIQKWLLEIERNANQDVSRLLVGNKVDKESERKVSYEEAKALAEQVGLTYAESSAKDCTNVTEIFEKMGQDIKQRLHPY